MVLLFKPIGIINDKYPAYKNIPISFSLRGVALIFFLFVENPKSWKAIVALILFIVGSIYENNSVDTLFNKNLPKDIRGTLNSAY
jgi:hypothetical protein